MENDSDRKFMRRCIELSVQSGESGEYPYGVIIIRDGAIVCESINRVATDRDVTRHAEVVAISRAQQLLDSVSLDECTIYVSAEPCAYCSYAIRESRIGRVVYALRAPHTGGVSKWPVLTDEDISNAMPEVFAPPPAIVGGFMAEDAEAALFKWNPVVAGGIKARGLFVTGVVSRVPRPKLSLGRRLLARMRRVVFDRFGRGGA
jgi:tRNA(adenine34) deaminase